MKLRVSRTGRTVTTIAALALLATTACSTQREDAGGGSAPTTDCANAEQAQEQYAAAWESAQKQLGLSGVEPADVEVCQVDTSKYAKEPRSGDRYRIGFAAQGPTNSWATSNEEAFKHRAEQKNVEVLYASANGDATKQVDNIADLASQDPDALVVVPMGAGITGQVRAAAKQDIPVVLCAGRLDGNTGAVSTVARSYELQGTLWAEWIAKRIGEKGKVAMLSGIAGVPTAEYQKTAAEETFAKYPGIELVTKQYTDWSPTKAKTVAANLVAKYPDLDAIWSDSAISDLGVVEAYEQAGKPVPPLTGDSSNAFLKAVRNKDVEFALSPFPPEQSTHCLDTALDILAGKPVLNVVNVDAPAFTHEKLDKYVRPECSDDLWVPTTLPKPLLKKLKLC